ncbi:MAG: hypothetical protein WBE93_27695, partial [Pseudolabrys sp.]
VKSNFYIEQAEIVRAVGAVSERLHTPNSAREERYVPSPAPCAIVRPWCLACRSTCSMRPSPRTSRH